MLEVVAAVIRSSDDRILIARRPPHLDQGGLWEFPGGKREPRESRLEALARELDEELGIQVRCGTPLLRLKHTYPDKDVALDIWEIAQWRGEASGREAQTIRWVAARELANFEFPAANATIITATRLPRVLVMPSAAFVARADFIEILRDYLRTGFRAFVLPACTSATLEACAALAKSYDATIHLAEPARGAALPDGIGLHLSAADLSRAAELARESSVTSRLSASVATAGDFRRAREIGVAWVVLADAHGKLLRDLSPDLRTAVEAEKVPTYKSAAFDLVEHSNALRDGFQGPVITDAGLNTTAKALEESFRRSLARASVVL